MAGQGLLLPDLAFRLTSIRFSIPPLRQRREGIAPLVQFLLDRICARYQQRPVLLGTQARSPAFSSTPGLATRAKWPPSSRTPFSRLKTASSALLTWRCRKACNKSPTLQFDPQLTSNTASNPVFNSSSTAPANPHNNPQLNPQINPQLNPWLNPSTGNGQMLDPQSSAGTADLALDTIINHHVQFVLDFNRGNKLRTARQLGISRSTLYRILANETILAR